MKKILLELGYLERAVDYNLLKIWEGEIGENYQLVHNDMFDKDIILIEDEVFKNLLDIVSCKEKYKTVLAKPLVNHKNNCGSWRGYYIFCEKLLNYIQEVEEAEKAELAAREEQLRLRQELKEEVDKNDIRDKERNRDLVFKVIESIVKPQNGVYVLDRNAQNKLYNILKDSGWELSVSRVLSSLDIKKSYGERDKTNWSTLYVYQDNFVLDEDQYDDLVEDIIDNWLEAPYISDISDMFKLDKNRKYIYGIKINDKLVYIGKTMRGLKNRILEHLTEDKKMNPKLNKAMEEFDFYFVVLYEDRDEILASDLDLQIVEKKLITYFKPEFNREGVSIAYKFK